MIAPALTRSKLFEAPRAVFVGGPTASGKSEFAHRLALELGGTIISADSMQIYRGLDIGTAKEPENRRSEVDYRLIDIVDAGESYSVSDFAAAAEQAARDAISRGSLPIVCGGTGLYFESLFRPLGLGGAAADPALRLELGALYDEIGGEKFRDLLRECDKASAEKLHPNDKKRLVRAMEAAKLTGKPLSEQKDEFSGDFILVCFTAPREELYARTDARADKMIKAGLPEEAARFLDALGGEAQSMKAIGYKEFLPYMDEYRENGGFSAESLAEIAKNIKKNTRNYAKRQLTWFRRYPFARWFAAGDHDGAADYVRQRLSGGTTL